MRHAFWLRGAALLGAAGLVAGFGPWHCRPAYSCCTVADDSTAVRNADQTVLIVWNRATRTEHFFRKASFKSNSSGFGFLVPTPTRPELGEADEAAFDQLAAITAAKRIRRRRRMEATAGVSKSARFVEVVEQRTLAGYDITVLRAAGAQELTGWLQANGYSYPPDVKAWAQPYIDAGWMITALKISTVANDRRGSSRDVTAKALRISFKTDQPLFPYREGKPHFGPGESVGSARLLRMYFVGDARYQGALDPGITWTGRTVWAGPLSSEAQRQLTSALQLAPETTPQKWYLTEFQDPWPYPGAPSDLHFARAPKQKKVRRPPVIVYAE